LTTNESEVAYWDRAAENAREQIRKTPKESLVRGISGKCWWENLIPKMEGKTILEVGCGIRTHAAEWKASGNEAYGIDISREQIKNATIIHKKTGLERKFVVS
jgi:2-polyprenyl-3-methyl-5-hydroxy-6-metoxy-1,4-benzoquinol methylase